MLADWFMYYLGAGPSMIVSIFVLLAGIIVFANVMLRR